MPQKTVKAASVHRQHNRPKWAPAPQRQQKEKAEDRMKKREDMEAAVDEWFSHTAAKANDLAERFGKKPRYFLDIFFNGGLRMVDHQEKTNPKNAFLSLKAQDQRDIGAPMKLPRLQEEFSEEYKLLTAEEREEIVREFEATKEDIGRRHRPSPCARLQDVANIMRNIQLLITSLKNRVGVEALVCLVRNTTEYHMEPQWYFTTPELNSYLRMIVKKQWDTSEVGAKLEAFAIAGCDVTNLCKTSKQRADYMKVEIRAKITEMLIEITGNPKAQMQYANYDEAIVMHYGIRLEGWTYPKIVNPSELSSSLPPLKGLLDAITAGTCKFIRLSAMERKKFEADYMAAVQAGEVIRRERKTRKDAGKKRKHTSRDQDGDEGQSDEESSGEGGEEDDAAPAKKKKNMGTFKSAATVASEDDDDET